MTFPVISFDDGATGLDWLGLVAALDAGHQRPRAEIADSFLYRGSDTMLNRAAWIDGMGLAMKTATVFPGNADAGKPTIGGGVCLYADGDGTLEALVDFALVTRWKTAGDSLKGALMLARPDSRVIAVLGAGTVAASLLEAYSAGFPQARFVLWNRSSDKAQALAATHPRASVAATAEEAVAQADIITCATMTKTPVLQGAWLRPGQHVDLIGAYRPDMREADDTALTRARIFVDSFDTTLDHIGELKIPLAEGTITRQDVLADFYSPEAFRRDRDDITLFKNGGGAHLDLMTARYILGRWQARQGA